MEKLSGVLIRTEQAEDRPAIYSINEAAFGSQEEAVLVDNLRIAGEVLLSLVAEWNNTPVGHILFSRMWIENSQGRIPAVALAPMAVLRDYQRRGIGSQLIARGLDALRAQGEKIVIVVGHAEYYPRFGFAPEKARALESPFPAEVFMALELAPRALDGVDGRVVYPPAFGL